MTFVAGELATSMTKSRMVFNWTNFMSFLLYFFVHVYKLLKYEKIDKI